MEATSSVPRNSSGPRTVTPGMSGEPEGVSRRALLKWATAGALATAAGGVLASPLQITRRTLRLPNWRANGFTVAHVSDVHVNNDGLLASAREAVRHAVAAKPDLFVFTGDLLNYDREDCLQRIEAAFEDLPALACPCLAVLGNHDYRSGALPRLAESVARTRMRLLVNEVAHIGEVRVVGLDDAIEGSPDFQLVSGAPSELVLLHEPDYAGQLSQAAGLVLSGHSHGGEVCLPGGTPLYTPIGSRIYKGGFYPNAPTPVYVNRGTATLGPARVFCPPEVAILTLVEQ